MTRTTLAGPEVQLPVYSVRRFAADCGRLLADVDRLISDIGTVIENHNGRSKTSRRPLRRSQLNGAASSLRQQAASFLTTLQHSTNFHRRVPIPFMELDEKATILRTNNEGNAALNGAGKQITGKSLFSYVAESDVDRLREHLELCKRTDKACVIQTLIKGKGLPVELRIRRHSIGKETGFLAVVLSSGVESDGIFAGQRWDQPLPISLQELSSSLNRVYTVTSVIQLLAEYCGTVLASPAGIIFIEKDGQPHVARQWQTRPVWKKILLRGVLTKGLVKQVFRTGNPAFWSPTKHGRHGVTFFPISTAGEQPAGVVAMVVLHHNTTTADFGHDLRRLGELAYASFTRARAYDDAVAAYSEAQKANRRKEELLSVISHELKNPLVPVLGWAVALSSGELSSEKQSMAVEGIIRNARALNYLIEDLFDLARISSGKLRLNKTEMRLQEVVREALTAIQPAAENKKLRISTDISEGIPPFVADPRRLRQMIINLLNNAVKFTPGGGSISLKVVKRGQCVECVVSDSGKGIDHKFLPFVFERFRQENRSQQTSTMGLGLGLTIVREIAELHGGKVTAQSAGPNQGATFTIQLPIRLRRRM